MEESKQANVISEIKLEVSENAVIVEIDGVRGEVRDGQARQVREALASYTLDVIMETTRQRRREQRMMEARARLADGELPEGGAILGAGQELARTATQREFRPINHRGLY